ncbi:hypothetical protein BGW38_007466, partial [Lunasporangiospora selenospora]
SSQSRLDNFHKAAQKNSASKEHGDLVLILDVRTRWNSTHQMIKRALLLRSAYNEICENNADMEGYAISESGVSLAFGSSAGEIRHANNADFSKHFLLNNPVYNLCLQ